MQSIQERFPIGSSATWSVLESDPYPLLERLRESEPVTWLAPLNGWATVSHELCGEVLRSEDRFETHKEGSKPHEIFGPSMLSSDDAEHRRHRDPFDGPFRARPVRQHYLGLVDDVVSRLVEEIRPAGEAELSSQFASLLPVDVMRTVLGVDMGIAELRSSYDDFAAALGDYKGDEEVDRRASATRAGFEEHLKLEFARMRVSEEGGVIGDVVRTKSANLTEEEVVSASLTILFGGIETVETLILNAVTALLTHPDALAELLGEPELVDNAVEETLRWSPPLGFLGRRTRTQTRLGDVELEAGEFVCALLPGANRDPAVFERPDVFDVRRANTKRLMSFGHGPHFCLGFNLAKVEATAAVGLLIQRLPGLRLVEPAPLQGFAFRRPASVHVEWEA